MTTPSEHELSPALAEAVHAAQEVPVAATAAAQQRLSAALHARRARARPVKRGWAMAALTALAALVLAIGVPLLAPQGNAFAAAQAHFRQFRTLQMEVVQRHGDTVLQTSRTRVDTAGATRTDIGESLSIVVDPARGRVLTLLHQERQAVVATITPQAASTTGDIAWLDELRRYTGKAVPLRETRLIAGRRAQGWALDLRGKRTELWTDDSGLPLEMRMQGSGLQIDYRFTFDLRFAPELFATDLPAGYTQAEAGEE